MSDLIFESLETVTKQDVKRKYNSMSAMLEQLVVEVKPEPVIETAQESKVEENHEEVQEELPQEKPEEIVKPMITKASETTIDFKYPPEVKLRNKKKTTEELEAKKKAEEAEQAQRRKEIEAEEARRLQEERENEILYKNLPESER